LKSSLQTREGLDGTLDRQFSIDKCPLIGGRLVWLCFGSTSLSRRLGFPIFCDHSHFIPMIFVKGGVQLPFPLCVRLFSSDANPTSSVGRSGEGPPVFDPWNAKEAF
jgi:hypothetical protein